jgi:peroxiredoxin
MGALKMADPTMLGQLPSDLPAPRDDGACDHLRGLIVPPIALPATNGQHVTLAELPGCTLVYAYPRTGRPGEPLPSDWDSIPGARGCTPQACAFRDHAAELRMLGVGLFGLSTQDTPYQQEAATRLHLPFSLLSDHKLALTAALRLPTFEVDGMTLLKRLTLLLQDGVIAHVWYPVFPPDTHAADVVTFLRQQAR